MPRVNVVKKCRKSPGTCSKCGAVIETGQGYLYWKFAYTLPTKRCLSPSCGPTRSDLTRSEFWKQVYSLQDVPIEASTIEELESLRDQLVEDLEQLRDEQEEKRSNMPEGLQESASGELLLERYDALSDVVFGLEGIDVSWEEPDRQEGEGDEAFAERRQQSWDERFQEIVEEIQLILGDISCG